MVKMPAAATLQRACWKYPTGLWHNLPLYPLSPLRVLQQLKEMVFLPSPLTSPRQKKNAGGGPGLGPHHLSSPVTVGGPLHPFLQIMLQACL